MTDRTDNSFQCRARRSRRGFYLLEVMIVVFIVFAMALMFAAVVPTSLRSVMTGSSYALAAEIAQRKLDQLMDPSVGYSNLTVAALQAGTTPVIGPNYPTSPVAGTYYDPSPTSSGTWGTSGYTMTGYFTALDGLRISTATPSLNGLPGDSAVLGTLTLSSWVNPTSSITTPDMMKATVTITWNAPGQGPSSYTQTGLIPQVTVF